MRDLKETKTGLNMTWVPVRDANGRVRMEARWAASATPAHKPQPHAA
jgi:hypothetical protein